MKTLINPVATTLILTLAIAAALPANAVQPATHGALATPANRIVGVWSNIAQIGPCGQATIRTLRQTLVFHAGGTFLDSSLFPPDGVANADGISGTHKRGIGVGTWSYSPQTSQYYLKQRFDWYVNNVYHGYQVVERAQMLLSSDGNTLSGGVRTVRYAANNSVIFEFCGTATSTRL